MDAVEESRARLAAAERAHPGNSVEVLSALVLLAQRLTVAGIATQEPLDVARRAVAIGEALGKTSLEYAEAKIQLAKVYLAQDHPETGRPLAEEALEIAEKSGRNDMRVAEIADGLGKICWAMGDMPCCLRSGKQAVEAVRKLPREDEMYLASMLQDLAHTELVTGDGDGARAAMEESVTIAERQAKPTRQMTVIENNAGVYFMRSGHLEEAKVHLDKALELSVAVNGAESIQVGIAASSLGSLYSRMGRYQEAWAQYERAMVLYRRWCGPSHSRTAAIENNYSVSLAAGGELKHAEELALEAHRSVREIVTLAIRVLPERQALAMAEQSAPAMNTALSILAANPALGVAEVYQEEIRSRALVTEEMARRQAEGNRKSDAEVTALIKELDAEREAALALRGNGSGGTNKGATNALEEATARMERTERAIAERSAAFRADERTRSVALEDVRGHLPAESVLISYVSYKRYVTSSPKLSMTTTPGYLAFVLHPNSGSAPGALRVFDLGDGKTIDALVVAARESADEQAHGGGLGSKRNERKFEDASEGLRKLIWDPLQGEMGGAKLVLAVPDGALNLMPFGALHSATGYLAEHGPVIHTLSSERDLVPEEARPAKQGLLVIGNPAFPAAEVAAGPGQAGLGKTVPDATGDAAKRGAAWCMDLRTQSFHPLVGSGIEAADIATSWRRWTRDEREDLATGEMATRELFLKEAGEHRVLHMATHAFLMDSRCGNGNPLLNSGLVFAGDKEHRQDSILTAQQIASMDLSGVDWAVLSACNTGNGELRDGEGVMGLQRAFRIAGARSVVMTLWPVDDEVTREFMHKLYEERLGRHASTANAVWRAERGLLLERRAAGKSTHPWYWAGFVGSGGWE